MKTLLAAAALVLLATSAHAGSNECVGTVDVGPELTTITDTNSSSLRDDQFGPEEPRLCQFKTNSPFGKRILRVCPDASECTLQLSINNNPSDHRNHGIYTTILKWPLHGVHCDSGCSATGRAKRN